MGLALADFRTSKCWNVRLDPVLHSNVFQPQAESGSTIDKASAVANTGFLFYCARLTVDLMLYRPEMLGFASLFANLR